MGAGLVTRIRNFVTDRNNSVPITASYTDAELDQLVASLNCKVIAKATAPSSPAQGDSWIDTTNNLIKMYDGSGWVQATTYSKGADIASGGTTDIGASNGDFVDVTGTTTITALGTVAAGTYRTVRFTGALTLTHNATSLILPGGANITTANGDCAQFRSLGSGNWKCINYTKADGTSVVAYSPTTSNALSKSVIQVVNTMVAATSSGTTNLPYDDTIPQNTEGDQYMTLAITPSNASNTLKIEVVLNGFCTTDAAAVALFQDTTANALAAVGFGISSWNGTALTVPCTFTHYMSAGTTSATTFKVRAGRQSSGTFYFNGNAGGRIFGGVMASSITITEYKA